MRFAIKRVGPAVAVLGLMAGLSGPARAAVVLDFEEFDIPVNQLGLFILGDYTNQGFNLLADAPNSEDPATFFVRDETDGFYYAGSQAIGATSEATIILTNVNDEPFSLLSIDVARYFIFNNATEPVTLTFTGQQVGGGIVTQSFTVATAPGVAAFDRFTFSGFTNLVSVSWQQELSAGQVEHQFDNITLELGNTAVPEPSSLVSGAIGGLIGLGYVWRRRKARATS